MHQVIKPIHVVLLFLFNVVLAGVFDRETRRVIIHRLRKPIVLHQIRPIVRPLFLNVTIRQIRNTTVQAPHHDLVKHIRQILLVKHNLKLAVTPLVEDIVAVAVVGHVLHIVDHQRLIAHNLAAVTGNDERVERHFWFG